MNRRLLSKKKATTSFGIILTAAADAGSFGECFIQAAAASF